MQRHTWISLGLVGALAAQSPREAEAKRQLDRALAGKAETAAPQSFPADPVEALVRTLDRGSARGPNPQPGTPGHAYNELRELGALANSTIHRVIDSLGPFGIKASLDLLVAHPDPRLPDLLRRFLASEDSARQLYAARAISRIAKDSALPLLELAERSQSGPVRACALMARARLGAKAAEVVAGLRRLLAEQDRGALDEVSEILVYVRGPEVVEFLGEAAQQGAECFAALAHGFLRGLDTAGEPVVLELLQRVAGKAEAGRALAQAIEYRVRDGSDVFWPVAAQKALLALQSPNDRSRLLSILVQKRVRVDPGVVLELWRMRSDSERGQILQLMRETGSPGTYVRAYEEVAFDLRESTSSRLDALVRLENEAPERLRELAPRLLADDSIVAPAIGPLARVPDAKVLNQLCRLLSGPVQRGFLGQSGFNPSAAILDAVAERSTAENLAAVLDLGTVRPGAGKAQDRVGAANQALNRWFGAEQIEPALARLHELEASIRNTILTKCRQLAQADPALAGRVRAGLARMIAEDTFPSETWLALPGSDPAELWQKMLKQQRSAACLARLLYAAPDFAPPVELQRLVVAQLVGLPRESSDTFDEWLQMLPSATRLAIARALLEGVRGVRKGDRSAILGALRALGDTHQAEQVPYLQPMLQDADVAIRIAAIEQLGRVFDKAAVPALLEALKDESQKVSAAAALALDRYENYLLQEEKWLKRLGK